MSFISNLSCWSTLVISKLTMVMAHWHTGGYGILVVVVTVQSQPDQDGGAWESCQKEASGDIPLQWTVWKPLVYSLLVVFWVGWSLIEVLKIAFILTTTQNLGGWFWDSIWAPLSVFPAVANSFLSPQTPWLMGCKQQATLWTCAYFLSSY